MGSPKLVTVKKEKGCFEYSLGKRIFQLVNSGYYKFEIIRNDEDELVFKAVRSKRGGR